MCLIAFAIGASKQWPLVIAANRDEFFDRPALPLARWQTEAGHNIVSGRDLLAGGSWLGISETGRIAMLTNVREVPLHAIPKTAKSRGELVTRWLDGEQASFDAFMAQIDPQAYGGFNLVIGDLPSGAWHCLSNRTTAAEACSLTTSRQRLSGWTAGVLEGGIYGLSNAALDTPWPKTQALKDALKAALTTASEAELTAHLWKALANRDKAATADLPETGLPTDLETALSAAFISEAGNDLRKPYGTRCSTVVLVRPLEVKSASRWEVSIEEITHPAPGNLQSGDVRPRSFVNLTI